MKKITGTILTVLALTLINCSPAEEIKDSLNSVECLERLLDLNEDSDNMSCSEVLEELDKIENSCSEFFNEDSRAQIALLREYCDN